MRRRLVRRHACGRDCCEDSGASPTSPAGSYRVRRRCGQSGAKNMPKLSEAAYRAGEEEAGPQRECETARNRSVGVAAEAFFELPQNAITEQVGLGLRDIEREPEMTPALLAVPT